MEELLSDNYYQKIAVVIYYRENNRYRLKLVAHELLLKMAIRASVRY
jgi:hypothetical protein